MAARRPRRLVAALAVLGVGVALAVLPAAGTGAPPGSGEGPAEGAGPVTDEADAAGTTGRAAAPEVGPPGEAATAGAADLVAGAEGLGDTAEGLGDTAGGLGDTAATSTVLDVTTAMAAMASSDGVLPTVASEVAMPSDDEGVYLAPDPGSAGAAGGEAAPPGGDPGGGAGAPGEETFGPASVIGPDERAPVPDATRFPWSAVALVRSESTNCTGWMVGPDLVLTAGHCVHDYAGFVRQLVVTPARQGDVEPFGRCGAVRSFTTRLYLATGELGADWGVIQLDCRVGEQTGWFGLRVASDAVVGREVVVAGYPMDRNRGTQWWAAEYVRSAFPQQLSYGGDTYSGQSGSPVFLRDGSCTPCGVAVHAYGVGATPDGYNSGSRVTTALAAVVAALRAS